MTTKYHPLLVALHWLMAVLLIGAIIAGKVILEETPNSDLEKVHALKIHMSVGLMLLMLVIIRLITRFTTKKPPKLSTGNKLMDRAAGVVHFLLYFFLIGQIFTGLGLAMIPELYPQGGNLFEIAFNNSGQPLPKTYDGHPLRAGHGLYPMLLLSFIVVHAGAALYHQFDLKDRLISRMWFGKRDQ